MSQWNGIEASGEVENVAFDAIGVAFDSIGTTSDSIGTASDSIGTASDAVTLFNPNRSLDCYALTNFLFVICFSVSRLQWSPIAPSNRKNICSKIKLLSS